MYKTFELFFKALYVIAFWTLIGYVLETRKIGTSFTDVALTTIMGWCVFLTVGCIFLLYITSSHAKHKAAVKNKITHEVVEDGMTFTVGGHSKFDPVLPKTYQVESSVIRKYNENNPIQNNINKALMDSVTAVKELIIQEENTPHLSENEIFDKNEGRGEDVYGTEVSAVLKINQPVESLDNENVKEFVKQSDEDIANEANKGYVAPSELSDSDSSRAIDKGIMFYQTQFNALYSYIINHHLYELAEGVRKGKIVIVSQEPDNPQDEIYRGKKIYTREAFQAKEITLKAEAASLRAQIDETLEKVLTHIPKFKYRGIETTTPNIKPRKEYDFSNYQLLIFTALFPFASWLQIRSNRGLNILDPKIAEHLTEEEKKKLDKSELGLSLRDKRVLFNARRMYDIYVHRDRDLAESGVSSYNMPFTIGPDGKKYNTLDEAVALCEFFRQAMTIKAIKAKPKLQKKKTANSQYSDSDLIGLISKLFHEKNRFNTQNSDSRIGIIKNDMIYIDYDSFVPKFNGIFAQRFPHLANNNEFTNAQYALYKKLTGMGLLAMRKRKDTELIESYEFYDKGELFSIYWDFGKGGQGITIENTLIIHAAQMFKDLVPMNQESNGIPRIMGVSQDRAIPHSPYSKQIQSLIEQAQIEKARTKAVQQEIIKANEESTKTLDDTLNDINALVGADTDTLVADLPSTSVAAAPAKAEPSQAPSDNLTAKGQGELSTDQIKTELNVDDDEAERLKASAMDVLKVYGANKTDFDIASRKLEKSLQRSAEYYLDRNVQVLQMRIAPEHEEIEVIKSSPDHKGRKYNFAVHENKNNIYLLKYSRSTVNEYAKTIDLTIIKLLTVARSQNYIDDTFEYSKDSKHLLISNKNIGRIFNVYEQMAIFQKKGESNLWKSVKSDFKSTGKNKKNQYDQLSIIECIEFKESMEEAVYKKMEMDMWDADKAKDLFKKMYTRLQNMEQDLPRLKISFDKDTQHYIIPKGMLGKLNRIGLEVNSFLAYVEQYKGSGDLKPELTKYSNNLFAFESDGTTQVNFLMIEGL